MKIKLWSLLLLSFLLERVCSAAARANLLKNDHMRAKPILKQMGEKTKVRLDFSERRNYESDDEAEYDEESEDSDDASEGGGSLAASASRSAAAANPADLSLGDTNWTAYQGKLDCNLYRTLSDRTGRIHFKEVVDPIAETVTLEMSYRGRGWLAIGLASNGRMNDNIVVMGLPDQPVSSNNPGKFSVGYKSVSGVRLLPDAFQTLQNGDIIQNNTHTVMRFTQNLKESNPYSSDERAILAAPATNVAIYATGGSNRLAEHNIYGVFEVVLTYCLKPDQHPSSIDNAQVAASDAKSERAFWMAHGFLMALGWGLLVPMAIGASLLRSILPFPPNSGAWFQIHRGLNVLAILCVTVGFVLALTKGNGDLLKVGGHQLFGLIVFTLIMLQMLSGILRPPAPPAPRYVAAATDSAVEAEASVDTLGDEVVEEAMPVDVQTMEQPDTIPSKTNASNSNILKSCIRVAWEYQHRILGFGLLLLAWITAQQGIELFKDKYDGSLGVEVLFWLSVVLTSGCILILWVYVRFFRRE